MKRTAFTRKIRRLFFHYQPGSDELATLWAILKFPSAHLPLASSNPEILFMTKGDNEYPPMSDNGDCFFGCGRNSPFNEHLLINPTEDTSCFKLVLEHMGILGVKGLRVLEQRITREDRYGAGKVCRHFSQIIKDMYDCGKTFEEVSAWSDRFFEAVFKSETHRETPGKPVWYQMDLKSCRTTVEEIFGPEIAEQWYQEGVVASEQIQKCFSEAQRMFTSENRFEKIPTYLGEVTLYAPEEVQTNPRIAQAARAIGADIIVIRSKLSIGDNQSVLIQVSRKSGLSLSHVLAALRYMELSFRGVDLGKRGVEEFEIEGTITECPEWHGLQSAVNQETLCGTIMSRSKTRPGLRGTQLDFVGIIIQTVKCALLTEPHTKKVASIATQEVAVEALQIEREITVVNPELFSPGSFKGILSCL